MLTAHIIQSNDEALARALAGTFAQDASARDRDRRLPWDELDAFSASGLWGITVPRAFGGAGVSMVTLAQVTAIIAAADRGSVIAKDHCNSILVKLARAGHGARAVPILVERLKTAAPNQFPTYAEAIAPVLTPEQRPGFLAVLTQRLGQIAQDSKRKRVELLMRKLNG